MGTEAPGKMMLKVSGIILIIFGGIAALASLAGILLGGAVGMAGAGAAAAGLIIFGSIIVLVSGAFNVVAGIMGVKNCNVPEKANICFVFGIIMVSLQVISFLMNLISGSLSGSVIISTLIGFVLPVIYLLGAMKNKNMV